ncbi:uncharacterized protein THITE_2118270 [Thermothielavioides terrestris NRRL 8126]|uniref:SGNH hydrolase-type esterase domain-containing protein n=1 Tax=Thermothielavioides terrestris (strain ATCC 38088 / NRRL 8126) TaxID=578455 RepID=G2R9E0_THETT|nr:uncharacterized protein THITE_2118270 [Thermothielavioides terrestris NRRL 8126]AEO68681.1 hypothetical protein THITE_2118270 [Thermothielavioides terrestris NRRL 8126]
MAAPQGKPPTTAATATTTATPEPLQSLLAPLHRIAKFKPRSCETSKTAHIPLLVESIQRSSPPTVVLLGDSMLECLTTTGASPNSPPSPWPSPTLLDDAALAALFPGSSPERHRRRLDGMFNAGVGGDRVQNVAYRLVGDEDSGPGRGQGQSGVEDGGGHLEGGAVGEGDEDGDGQTREGKDRLPGLLPLLASAGNVKLWVVHAGTNNITGRKGLANRDVEALAVVLRALLGVSRECRVLLTGLFYRADVAPRLVDKANGKLKEVVESLNKECLGRDGRMEERVVFLPAPRDVTPEEHLVDHVHLGLEGYRLWIRELFPAVVDMLRVGTT